MMAKQVVVVAALAAAALVARPAVAQLALGSPNGPPRLELGWGAWDITPHLGAHNAATAGDFRGEYHFGDLLWIFSPFVGVEATTAGASYVYAGYGFDFYLTPNWVLTPNGAVGWFQRGTGTDLGAAVEFRTGLEIDYKFDDQSRLGLAVHHISNAGIGRVNPGEQSVVVTYQVPIPLLHW